MFQKGIKNKTIAFLLLIPAVIISLGTILLAYGLASFGFASGVSPFQLLPLFFVSFFFLSFSGTIIYISFRYFKNNPFKQNKGLGKFLVFGSLAYFIYQLIICILSNLTGNEGGFAGPIIAFLLLLILFPLGLSLLFPQNHN